MANFDHLTTAILKFWPWSWSKIFDHLTMTPGRRPNGQKIVVILPPPPLIWGGKALTMTMTPWNLPHGQWSKKLTMTMRHPRFCPWSMVKLTNFDHLTTVILEFWPWSWSKMAIFDHLTMAILKFWPWSWSKIFDHLTMTPGHRPNGQKIVVILPPPP